jgi:hypothetical protein
MSTEEATLEIKISSTTEATESTMPIERPNGMLNLDSSCVYQQKNFFTLQINAIEHFFQSRTTAVYIFWLQ